MNVHAVTVGQTDEKSKRLVGQAGTGSRYVMQQAVVADPKKIGARIKALRHAAGQTQQDVAEALGIARSTYGEMENGTDRGGLDSILAVADYFKVPLDWLLLRTPPAGGPLVGYFLDDPDELAWLQLWRAMNHSQRSGMTLLLKQGTATKIDEVG